MPSHANLSYKTSNLRTSKPKSNDVPSLLVQMPPLQLNVQFVEPGITQSVDDLEHVEEVLTELAAGVLNSTFDGRLEDVEFSLQDMTKYDGAIPTYDQMIHVQGNATFVGSYYLEDPEVNDVTFSLMDGLNKGMLLDSLNGVICQVDDCLAGVSLEVLDSISSDEDHNTTTDEKQHTDEEQNDNVITPAASNEHGLDSQSKQQSQPSILSSESRSTDNQTDNNGSSKSTSAWVAPTVVLLALATALVSLFVYRRNQHEKQSKDIQQTDTLESSPPSSPSSILKREADKYSSPSKYPNSNITAFNKKSIDQLLQEFTADDISLISSDLSNDGNASHYSGFSNFSDLDLQKSSTAQVLNLQEAAMTSSASHNPTMDKAAKNNTTYLPCALQKQESFEGTYRTISAMASVLRKDMLHVVGDNGDDSNVGSGGRTESPKKSMERMERQRMRERGLDCGGDIPAVGRVGIRPAAEEELENGNVDEES